MYLCLPKKMSTHQLHQRCDRWSCRRGHILDRLSVHARHHQTAEADITCGIIQSEDFDTVEARALFIAADNLSFRQLKYAALGIAK